MVRTTIMLPITLKRQVELRAKRERKSLGRFVRESLERSVGGEAAVESRVADPLFADHAEFDDSAPNDVAENHDAYLLRFLQQDNDAGARHTAGTLRRRKRR